MKTDLNLRQLSQTLKSQNESKRDFIVNTNVAQMNIVPDNWEEGPFGLSFNMTSDKGKAREEYFELSRYAMGQIASHTKVPMQLVDLLSKGTVRERIELGNLLSVRLQDNEATRMIRTMSNNEDVQYVRAFLSDRYRRIDNFDLAQEAILPVLKNLGEELRFESLAITDERMYMKVIFGNMRYDIGKARDFTGKKVGDIIEAGAVISNSEVGAGRFSIEPMLFRIVCLNGMIANDAAMKRNHVGRQNTLDGTDMEASELFTDTTLALDDAAFFGKVKDTLSATFEDEDRFESIVVKFMESKGEPIKGHAQAAVTELAKRFTINEDDRDSILDHLIQGGDLTKFGLVNAVTAFARDDNNTLSYNRATDFEKLGGQVLELGPSEWKVISNATTERIKKARNN